MPSSKVPRNETINVKSSSSRLNKDDMNYK